MTSFLSEPAGENINIRGFTLIEILVSLVILTLIVLLVSQMLSGSTTAILKNNQTMNALDDAQVVFQQVGLDISRMVLRDDVDYSFINNPAGTSGNLAGNDILSFYARTSGLCSTGAPPANGVTPRPLSVVAYKIKTNSQNNLEFDYGALQVDWNNPAATGSAVFALSGLIGGVQTQLFTWPNTLPNPNATPDAIPYTTLASEVIRFEYCFVLKSDPNHTTSQYLFVPSPSAAPSNPLPSQSNLPTSANPNPLVNLENVAAMIVGIVVVDSKSRLLMASGTDLKLAQLFPDAVPDQDILSLWTPVVSNSAKLEQNGVPVQAVAGVHVYQKYFPLPW